MMHIMVTLLACWEGAIPRPPRATPFSPTTAPSPCFKPTTPGISLGEVISIIMAGIGLIALIWAILQPILTKEVTL